MLWLIYSTVNSVESGDFTGAVKYLIHIHQASQIFCMDLWAFPMKSTSQHVKSQQKYEQL